MFIIINYAFATTSITPEEECLTDSYRTQSFINLKNYFGTFGNLFDKIATLSNLSFEDYKKSCNAYSEGQGFIKNYLTQNDCLKGQIAPMGIVFDYNFFMDQIRFVCSFNEDEKNGKEL
jgi:hypothetical protein